jgi:hypothetical protein
MRRRLPPTARRESLTDECVRLRSLGVADRSTATVRNDEGNV